MDCEHIREALSAGLDGEDPGADPALVDQHLEACTACRAWAGEVEALHRLVRVRPAEEIPDLTARIVATAAPVAASSPRRASAQPVSGWRWSLFVVALTQLVLAGPALLLGEDAGATVHVARELGSFDAALAVGLLVAAWQPARAWGLLPLAAALGCVLTGTALLDLVEGTATGLGEAHHILDLAGIALLWLVARETRGLAPTSPGRSRWSAA